MRKTLTVTELLGSVLDSELCNVINILEENKHNRLANRIRKAYDQIISVKEELENKHIDYDTGV